MTELSRLSELAERLRALHRGPDALVLPNAWDAASAQAVVEAGFPCVATTSSGAATSLGWADGEDTPPEEMFAALARIARVIDVPLTADIEAGYSLTPDEIVQRLLAAGAVGCNLEDTDHRGGHVLRAAEQQADTLAAVRRAADSAGVRIVINARADVFLRAADGRSAPNATAGAATAMEEAIRRGRLYLEAGADCIFPIGAPDESAITALADGIPGPINVIAGFRGAPGVRRLKELGVRRISFAGRLHRAAFDEHKRRLAAIARGEEI